MRVLEMSPVILVLALSGACQRDTGGAAGDSEGSATVAQVAPETAAPEEPSQAAPGQTAAVPAGGPTAPTAVDAGAWPRVEPSALSEAQRAQRQEAESARDDLAGDLMGQVAVALENGGPPNAIRVCREVAPEVAARISAERGVQIGRTSHRLRNPANAPPEWAADWVRRQEAEPAFFAGPEGQLGALYPIRLAEMCGRCHGQLDRLSPGVQATLADLYPDDQATGFSPGDLRGWFWVVVPQ